MATELVHREVARRSRDCPDRIAVVDDRGSLTYRELDAAACRWAVELAHRGVGPSTIVPVRLPRSARLIVTLLAVLRCGAAYSALDLSWPQARVADVVDSLDPPIVIADEPFPGAEIPVWSPPPRVTDHMPGCAVPRTSTEVVETDGDSPACVFFTSGTTGRPKGVVTPHRALLRLFEDDSLGERPNSDWAVLQAAPVPWDAFALEVWAPLTAGGTCVVAGEEPLLPGDLSALIQRHGVTTAWLTSSLFNLFVDEEPDCFRGLHRVLTGGERLSVPHVARFLETHPAIHLVNGYGPVESCVFVTTHRITGEDVGLPGGIPVGRPVAGTGVHVLDGDAQIGPGEPGEICVSGRGLSLGYLGDPERTATAFPTIRIDGVPTRVYRTGDVGMLDGTGVLHFRGRADRQVKIAGHRVELDGVEAVARTLSAVRDCVVVPLRGAHDAPEALGLCCVPEDPQVTSDSIRGALAAELPGYLVPTAIRLVGALPRTSNGKVDLTAVRSEFS